MGLGPIDEDVRFDHEAASTLISLCNSAAGVIEGQTGSRAGWVTTAKEDFAGYYSELFARNQENAQRDAAEIATRLRDVARFAGLLSTEASQEQQRREEARAWQREREDRAWYEEGWDWVTNNNDAPVPDMPEPSNFSPTVIPPQPRETPRPGSGGGSSSGGTSSARPDKLRTFANGARGANSSLSEKPTGCRSAYNTFVAGCGWGTLVADDVFTGFASLVSANEEDVRWVDTIADAFERAGSDGTVSTLSNSALTAALQSQGIDASRQDIVVDPPQAMGNPPTSGYADDPVNAATGNFIENERDLSFIGGAASLALTRTYNSFDTTTGAFGPGWSSWTEAGLEITDEAARMRLEDGRVVVFARSGEGWLRATGEARWLSREGDLLVATTNDGERRVHTRDGRLQAVSRGAGTTVTLTHEATSGRLVRMDHERGRWIELTWSEEWAEGRVVEARTSDDRTATYTYDEAGHLTGATTTAGTRTYQWDDQGLLVAVLDADGVVEVENTYDGGARVTAQRSAHGRISRYVYLPGNVTVVSDREGTRSNTWTSDQRGRLIGVVDSDEQRTSFAYDTFGNRVMVTERDGSTTVREHDDRGRLVREVTPSGADITYGYDAHDRVTTVVTESGAVTEYTYPDDTGDQRNPTVLIDPEGGRTGFTWTDGLLTRVVDPVGVAVKMDYDEHGDLIGTTDALGHTARLERDSHGRVVAAVTPLGHRTSFVYAPSGALASRQDPDGSVWRYEHTAGGRLAAIVDPTGARTEIEYNDAGDAARTIDPLGRSVTRHFDDLGNLASAELPDGSTWRFAHDAMSRLTSTTTPDGSVWAREYDVRGTLSATMDPSGGREDYRTERDNRICVDDGTATTSLQLDSLGRPVVSEQPDGSTVMATYDRCGRPVERLDAEGGLTRTERDAAGRPVRVTTPAGLTTLFEYDARGLLTAIVDPAGNRTERTLDADRRVVAVTLPTGERSEVERDACGRVVAVHQPGRGTARYRYDPAGRVVEASDTWHGRRRFGYDAAGQLTQVTNGMGGTTHYEHDANGRPVAMTDPLGHTTRRAYDAMNRLVSHTDPLGRTTTAGYTRTGLLAWHEDPTGRRVEWTHDHQGRVDQVTIDGRVVSSVTRDLRERRLTISDHSTPDAERTIELEWDRRGLLTSRSRDGHRVTWAYDADGRRRSMTTPDGATTSYGYDGSGRLATLDHPLLGRATFTRDGSGRLVEASAGGVVQTWEYADGYVAAHTVGDDRGFTRTVIHRDDSDELAGRISAVSVGERRTVFSYDEACQLIEARLDGSVSRWRYDAGGRLVTETADQVTVEHSYDAAGQLVASDDGSRRTDYHYDGLGRRVRETSSDGMVRELSWSPTGWLSGVHDRLPGGDERRTTTSVDATGQLAEVDGVSLHWDSASFAPSPVQAGDTPVLATGALTGIGEAWSATGWRAHRATGADPWAASGGSVGLGVRASGDLPEGLTIGADGGVAVAGMEWLGARVYDPASRGFLSTDPLEPVIGAGWAGNPYSYAGNDPLHALDPQGLRPLTDQDLTAYNAANNTGLAAAGDWVAGNWEYLVAGAAIIGGAALCFTGVGGPAGAMLIAGGMDLAIQKAQLQPGQSVNWGQVALSTAMGAVPGASGLAGRIPGVTSHVARTIVGQGITGAGTGAVSGAYGYATGGGPHTVNGFLNATGSSALWGGATGAATGAVEVGGVQHAFNSATRVDVPVDEATAARNLLGQPGDTVVLGRQPDTAVAADWPGHSVLNTPDWSPTLNDEYVQGAMDYQRPIYLASEPAGNLVQTSGEFAGQPTIFARELDQLSQASYTRYGDEMVMP